MSAQPRLPNHMPNHVSSPYPRIKIPPGLNDTEIGCCYQVPPRIHRLLIAGSINNRCHTAGWHHTWMRQHSPHHSLLSLRGRGLGRVKGFRVMP